MNPVIYILENPTTANNFSKIQFLNQTKHHHKTLRVHDALVIEWRFIFDAIVSFDRFKRFYGEKRGAYFHS